MIKEKKRIVLLTRTYSTDPDYDGDCSYSLIYVDKDFATRLRRQRKSFEVAKKADNSLFEMYFWGGCADWFGYGVLDKLRGSQVAKLDDGEVLLPSKRDFRKLTSRLKPENVECQQIIIREEEFCLIAIPKHSNVYVNTQGIPYEMLEALR